MTTSEATQRLLRALPAVEALVAAASKDIPLAREHLTALARDSVEQIREQLLAGKHRKADAGAIADLVQNLLAAKAKTLLEPSMRKVINATGIVLHTGLGRAVIAEAAARRVEELIRGYLNLEFDLEHGTRGDRTSHVEALLQRLTGAEAACVVNNNAAAVLLALNSLANRREVVVSRGELVEIGGSFRIPDVMKKSGARMVEVGTTNKTHRRDFAGAITPRTAGFLHVHTSNYRVQGFTAQVALAELVALAHEHDLFVLHDLGGGILLDLQAFGLPYEPVVRESVEAEVDVTTFSGDKVLGGPQCGVLAGTKAMIGKIKRNPMMRALRCDKLTYIILEETLRLFLDPRQLVQHHDVLRMLSEPAETVQARAEQALQQLQPLDNRFEVAIVSSDASAGSGALPLEKIPSFALRVRARRGSVNSLARHLRLAQPAVVGYTQHDALHLDFRTVQPSELPELCRILRLWLSAESAR